MDLQKLNWKSVQFENVGFNANFQGLIGIEECSDYGIISNNRKKRSMKTKPLKRKSLNTSEINVPSSKKMKNTSFGDFQVENIDPKTFISPSKTTYKINEESSENCNLGPKSKVNKTKEKLKNKDEKSNKMEKLNNGVKKNKEINKTKDSNNKESDKIESIDDEVDVNLEDMQAWSRFNLPDVILKGLAVQKFVNPTVIQELTLPAAMFGRRDILGAAETGSGKTLAFGIPILNAIIQMKQKPFMGVNEIFRKPKKGIVERTLKDNEKPNIVNFNKLTKQEQNAKINEFKKKPRRKRNRFETEVENEESEIDSSEGEDDESSEPDTNEDINYSDEVNSEIDDLEENLDSKSDSENDSYTADDSLDLDLEDEMKKPIPKKIDSGIEDDDEKPSPDCTRSGESDFEEHEEEIDGVDEEGIGCVKVIDNITLSDFPNTQKITKKELKPLYGLILTPTRELAIQVKNHLVAAAKFTDISVAVVVGGMSQEKQERLLSRGPEIVVATPGRLWQLIQMGNPHLSQISDIRFLAIDETDRMLEHGHFEELHQLLERLNEDEDKKGGRQNFVFSATLTMVHDLPKYLRKKKVTKKGKIINKKSEKLTADQKLKKVIAMLGITDPKIVDITKQNQGASTTLTECRITCPIDHKDYYLYYVLKRYPGRTIIFCNSIGCVKRLSQLFGLLQCNPLPLHANMQQRQRLKNLDRFRANSNGILVATDVAARGLDIPDVEHVIHYQVPRTAENYVHRSGRTARASKEGITILIMEAGEIQSYNKMCKTLGKKEDLPHFPIDGPLLSAVMQRVDIARELDLLMWKLRKENNHKGWLEKAAKDMDMLLDDRNMPRKNDSESSANDKSLLTSTKKQLNVLLATPLFPKGFSFKYPTLNNNFEEAVGLKDKQNAIQVMKTAIETGTVNKKRNATKNEALLKLEQKQPSNNTTNHSAQIDKSVTSTKNNVQNGEKISKNKWKKLKRSN